PPAAARRGLRRRGWWGSSEPGSCQSQRIMRGAQGREHVAAYEDKGLDPGLVQGGFEFARPAGEMNCCAGRLPRFPSIPGFGLIELVRRAEARNFRGRGLERRDHVISRREAIVRDSLEAARLVKILREHRTGGEM